MTYKDESTREAFHQLDTAEQIGWMNAEEILHPHGYQFKIILVERQLVSIEAVRYHQDGLSLAD